MPARVRTVAFHGVEVIDVEAQVTFTAGLPAFALVGLPDKAVAESRERVRAALASLGLGLPPKRITVNLAPADVVKEGSHFDLPIALGLLAAMEALPADELGFYTALGELALDGSLTGVAGVLLAALAAAGRGSGVICPAACGGEAAWAGEVEIIAAPSLLAIVNHFKGTQLLPPPEPRIVPSRSAGLDLVDVKGQESAKRALEIAAAGGHNLLMVGPPGSGKSMLAARLPGILPPLEPAEALELGMIQSVAGGLRSGGLSRERPFRDPHHSASLAALVGGGPRARPGEISLAHQGVLFLDELPEFRRNVLEALRQPLEDGVVTLSRAAVSVSFPARFMLAAAMNPCPCGHHGDLVRPCRCEPVAIERYRARVSGPLLDRIDIHLPVPAVPAGDLTLGAAPGEASASIRARVEAARRMQRERFRGRAGVHANAHMSSRDVRRFCPLAEPAEALLRRAMATLGLSARAWVRVLKLARTIADLTGVLEIAPAHVSEAIQYRSLDRVSMAGARR